MKSIHPSIHLVFISLVLGVSVLSCDRFEFSPYQVLKQTYSDLNNQSITNLVDTGSDTIRVAVIGDSQRFFEATENIIDKINARAEIDFIIHTGDLVDFGVQREYDWMHELLSTLHKPYIAVIGNHDLIGNGDEIYLAMYGPLNFSFTYKGTKFIYINTNGREFGFDQTIPDVTWIRQELSDTTTFNQAIAVMHVAPAHEDFDSAVRDSFHEALQLNDKTILAINGHNHNFSFDYSETGLPYLNSYSTTKEKFILLKIWSGGFSFESH